MTANGELNAVLLGLAQSIDEYEKSSSASSKTDPSAPVLPSLQFTIQDLSPLEQIGRLREKLNLLFSTLLTKTPSGANSSALRAQNEELTQLLERQQAAHVLATEAMRRQMAEASAAEAERREQDHTAALARVQVVNAAQAAQIIAADQAAADARRRDEEHTAALAAARLVNEAQIEDARQAAAAQKVLNQQLAEQQARADAAEEEARQASARATAAELAKTTRAASNNTEFQRQLGEFQQASTAELAELQRQLTAAQGEREEARQQLEAQRQEHEADRQQHVAQQEEQEAGRQQLAAKQQQDYDKMLNHTKELMLFNEELSAFRRTAEERTATLEAQIGKLERDLETLRQNVATSKAEGEEAEARALAADGRLAAADAAATASRERQATSDRTITRLEGELAAATAQLTTVAENHAREMANATTGRNSNKTAAVKALEDTKEAHRQQVAALEAAARGAQEGLDAERAATEAARQEAQRVQDELRQANVRHEQQLTVIEQSGRGRMEAVKAAQAKAAEVVRLQEELKEARTACRPGTDAEETRRLLVKEMLELWETNLKLQILATGAPASEFPKLPKESTSTKVKQFADLLRRKSPLNLPRNEAKEPRTVSELTAETKGIPLSIKELFEIYDATLKIFHRGDNGTAAAAAAAVGGSGAPVSRLAGGRLDQGGSSRSPFAAGTSFRRNRKSRRSTRKTRR